jgi:hypothetical protein
MDGEQAAAASEQPAQDSQAAQGEQAAASAGKPVVQPDTFQIVADMVDRGETTLERGAKHIAESFELAFHEVRAEIAKLLPDGHSEKPVAQDQAPQVANDESKVATPTAVALPTVEEAKADLDANPGRASVLSDAGHIVREP